MQGQLMAPGSGSLAVGSLSPQSLQQEFRSITRLLTLVTALNSRYGHSTLENIEGSRKSEYIGALEQQPQSNRSTALNAIATLLVRNSEVIAATAHESLFPLPESQQDEQTFGWRPLLDPSKPVTSYMIFAMQNEHEKDWMDIKFLPKLVAGAGFTAVANPDSYRDLYFKEDLEPDTHCVLTPRGQSHWSSLLENPWYGLTIPSRDPLINHVATLKDYIDVYHHISVEKREAGQNHLFKTYHKYMISVSWRKMLRRFRHWSSQGFIYILRDLDDSRVKEAAQLFCNSDEMMKSRRRDSALGAALLSQSVNMIKLAMDFYPHEMKPGDEKLTELKKMFQELATSNDIHYKPYNPLTAAEFHCLLVGLLRGYGHSLHALRESMLQRNELLAQNKKAQGSSSINTADLEQRIEDSKAMVEQRAETVFHYTYLLWRVSHSQFLRYHLAALEYGSKLQTPQPTNKIAYFSMQYATSMPQDDDEATEIATIDADDDEIQRLSGLPRIGGSSQDEQPVCLALMFQRWLRLQASHCAALDIISSFNAQRAKSYPSLNLDISLFAVKPPPPITGDWQSTIRNLGHPDSSPLSPPLPNASPDHLLTQVEVADVIELIQKQLEPNQPLDVSEGKPELKKLLQSFRTPDQVYSGTVHCEAALASLAKYTDEAMGSAPGILKTLIQRVDQQTLAVSKLCCPICWELLKILRGNEAELFHVRGYHSTISMVSLPAWLPVDVLQEMVHRFRTFLCRELKDLLAQNIIIRSLKHKRNISLESNSGYSDASDISDTSGRHILFN